MQGKVNMILYDCSSLAADLADAEATSALARLSQKLDESSSSFVSPYLLPGLTTAEGPEDKTVWSSFSHPSSSSGSAYCYEETDINRKAYLPQRTQSLDSRPFHRGCMRSSASWSGTTASSSDDEQVSRELAAWWASLPPDETLSQLFDQDWLVGASMS